MARLRLLLHREVLRLRAAGLLAEDQFRGLYISDEQVDAILRHRYASASHQNHPGDTSPTMAALSRRILEAEEAIDALEKSSVVAGNPVPLMRITRAFSLSKFERDALLLCAAADLDVQFEILLSYAQNDVTRKRPTPDLILRLLGHSYEERFDLRGAFSPAGNLIAGSLIRFVEPAQEREPTMLARPLKIAERVIDFLLEHPGIDIRLQPFTHRAEPTTCLEDLQLLPRLISELRNAAVLAASRGGILFFHGSAGTGKSAAAAALSEELDRPLLVVDAAQACTPDLSPAALLALLRREILLDNANVYLAHAETLLGDNPRSTLLANFRPPAGSLLFVGTEIPWPGAAQLQVSHFTFEFPCPSHPSRLCLWKQAMNRSTCRWSGNVEAEILAGKFVLTGGEIRAACLDAGNRAAVRGDEIVSLADIEAAARAQSNQGLRSLTQKIDRASRWGDLILPPRALRQLREICATEKHRNRVYSQWGFGEQLACGAGLTVLFHGPSGTGKTMAAGIIAANLGLDLYKIDLSTVVSKYIGETEKQLSRIFREARSSNAILFFDEADALFGKRSEVKDAHDRYANIEVAYLLQKMEEYEGIVILATNFRKNMDDAFTRRLQHILEFPFPDAEHRERIWRTLLPEEAPVAPDVNFGFLARQFELTGGNIRNVVLAAAFLAATDGGTIGMEHFILATARELQKLGKLPGRSEFREYYDLIRTAE